MKSDKGPKRTSIRFIASLSLLGIAALYPLSSGDAQPSATPECENTGATPADLQQLINAHGLKDFDNQQESSLPPTSGLDLNRVLPMV